MSWFETHTNPLNTFKALCVLLVIVACKKEKVINKDSLWYDKPATNWMKEALPIGNGYMGAMFFGGIKEERIQFNEESLWTGGKGEWKDYNGGNRENAHQYLPKIRQLLKEGQFEKAHELANRKLTGVIKADKGHSVWEGFGAYQAFGDIFIKTKHEGKAQNYHRKLNISDAMGTISYKVANVNYQRTYFASYPQRVLVFQFTNDDASGTDYVIKQRTPHQNTTIYFKDNQLISKGQLENNGMAFESRMLVDSDGSSISYANGELSIKAAKTVTLYLTAATDYKNEYPTYKGRDYKALNEQTITNVQSKTFDEILKQHKKDYRNLYDRVTFKLSETDTTNLPTDHRLKVYSSGKEDFPLEALYFQYGRYLMISSSRQGTLPANLQGKWNDKTNPPWASDYHANINIQMIYWPTEITNLAECHEPLIDYIDKLREPGHKTAKDFFNAKGWVVNTMNNTFGYTAPGWDFPWGFFPGGAAWYSRHVWEHYAFNRDEDFLRQKGYPIMKDAALFWLDYLITDPDGHLVSSPSYSPEHGGISTGAYMDIQIVWDLFSNCIAACDALGTDNDFKERLILAKSQLLPLKIGKWGQLQEWKEDRDSPDNKHRHVSHLYALYPGRQINATETPKLSEAAQITLKARGDDGTGWSIAWKINFWARLKDGNHAYELLNRAMQITSTGAENTMGGGGVYPNLLSTHPPFQLDGNMGATAGMAEMLLQSHSETIQILPALPGKWENGKIAGLKARGNIEVDIQWEEGQAIKIGLLAKEDHITKVDYNGLSKELELSKNQKVWLDGNLNALN